MRAMGCICIPTSGEDGIAMHDTWYLGSSGSVQQAQNNVSVRYKCTGADNPVFVACYVRRLRVSLLPLDGMLLYHSECDPKPYGIIIRLWETAHLPLP